MSLANVLAGIGGAYQAVQKGMDDAQARKDADQKRKWLDEDRAFQTEQRGIWRTDQQRKDTEWKRKDDEFQRQERIRQADADAYGRLGTEAGEAPAPAASSSAVAPGPAAAPKPQDATTFSPIPTADKVTPPDPSLGDRGVARVESATMSPGYSPASDSTPAEPTAKAADAPVEQTPKPAAKLPKRTFTYGDVLREMAKSRSKEGMSAEAMKLKDDADKWDLNQAVTGVQRLMANSATMSGDDLVKAVSNIYDNDPLPTKMRNFTANSDGTFTGEVFNPANGASQKISFKNKDEMLKGLLYHYQPEQFMKVRAAADEAAARRRDELTKPFTLKPGEVRQVVDESSGKVVTIGEGGVKPGYELVQGADGSVTMRPIPKDGKGKEPGVADIVMDQATKGEVKLSATQISDAQLRATQIKARGVPDYVAANVAVKVAQDPTLIKPSIDPRTGEINGVYNDAALGEIVVDKGFATAKNRGSLTDDQLKMFAKTVVDATDVKGRDQFLAAAFDPNARAKFEGGLKEEITKQFNVQIEKNPKARAELEAQRDATIKSSLLSLERKFDLVGAHYPKPKVDNQPARTEKKTLAGSNTLGMSRYEGLSSFEANKQAMRDADQAKASAPARPVLDRAAAAKDPDIIRLEAERSAALRAGKPMLANAKIEEIKRIQADRYTSKPAVASASTNP